MQVTLEIPDEVVRSLPVSTERDGDLATTFLECFSVEAYRQGLLSAAQVGRLMSHASRWETEDFLASHDAWPYLTPDEAAEDARALSKLLEG